jgi:hypothetical protein
MTDVAWRQAIIQVLRNAGTAMHYTDIAEEIVSQGLRQRVGATPAATVNGTISVSLTDEATDSPFVRVGRGEYMLRELARRDGEAQPQPGEHPSPPIDDVSDAESSSGIIRAFAMYWQRNLIGWNSNPALLGRQQLGADAVDFSGQKGVYLLHDARQVVYVGRAIDRPLGRRFYEHTQDRLRGRWDRFSWFGLLKVTDSGQLLEPSFAADMGVWIATMEALLIEGLEPPQNRKRGDDFSAIEYLQVEDPEIERQAMLRLLGDMQDRIMGR